MNFNQLYVHIVRKSERNFIIAGLSIDKKIWYFLPDGFQDLKSHPVLSGTKIVKQAMTAIKRNNGYRKVNIKFHDELQKQYMDEEGNICFKGFPLEEFIPLLSSSSDVTESIQAALEDRIKELETQLKSNQDNETKLYQIEKKFVLEKFENKQTDSSEWLSRFEKECIRFKIDSDKMKIEALRFFIDGSPRNWYEANFKKFSLNADWTEWRSSFLTVFVDKGWSTVRKAHSYKYLGGSLIDYALVKENLCLEAESRGTEISRINLIVIGLPQEVQEKLDREEIKTTKKLYIELRKLEDTYGKKRKEGTLDSSLNKSSTHKKKQNEISRKPCNICEDLGWKNRFHLPAECRNKNSATDELAMEKEKNRKLDSYIKKIIQEFKEKTPFLQKEREDYEQASETISELTKHNANMILECHRLREECSEAKKLESRAMQENQRMKRKISDLSRQVCNLLKEIEASRAASTSSPDRDISSMDELNSSDIISKKLVIFNDIEELQANNQKLLALVRELSSKNEEAEFMDPSSIMALKDKVNSMRETQNQMLINQEQQNRMLENAIRQRDAYRSLRQKSVKLPMDEDIPMDQSSNTESDIQKSTVDPEKEKKIKELEEKLTRSIKELDTMKEEYETYKKEKAANDKILIDQVEQLRKEHRELTQINCKLTSMIEYNEERFKILKQNAEVYKNQINALEEKNKTYDNTIVTHKQSIMHLKDEALNAQTKLSRAEVNLQNAQQENRLLRDSEARLLKEKEIHSRDSHRQSLLFSNLELIKASLDRNETEGKLRLETRLRRRLQEEQDKFRELSSHLEKQTQNAQQRMERRKRSLHFFILASCHLFPRKDDLKGGGVKMWLSCFLFIR